MKRSALLRTGPSLAPPQQTVAASGKGSGDSGGFQAKLPPVNYPPQLQVEKLKGELFSRVSDAASILTINSHPAGASEGKSSSGNNSVIFPEIYEGQVDSSKRRHGSGVLRWPNGNTYIGQWRAGAMHGSGTFFYSIEMDSYTGEFAADKKHGSGCYVFANGNSYTGEFRDDRRNGQGKYAWQCGDEYVGGWLDGKMHGDGVTIYNNGNRYQGKFVEDRREGRGTLICSDGLVYEGEWSKNNRHGRGKISFPSGDFYEGAWADDRKHGHGLDVMKNGSRFEGEYAANVRSGAGSMVFANGDKYVGEFRDDKMHGRGKYDFSNGFVYDGDWNMDMRHGRGSYTFPAGHVYVGLWSNDRRSGAGRLTVFNGGKGGLDRQPSSASAGEEALCEVYVGTWLEGKMHGHFDVFLCPAALAKTTVATSPPPPPSSSSSCAAPAATCTASSSWEYRFYSGAWTNGAPSGDGCFIVPVHAGLPPAAMKNNAATNNNAAPQDPSVLIVKGAWGKSSDSAGDGTIYRPSGQVLRVLRGASLVAQQQQQQQQQPSQQHQSSSSRASQWWQVAGAAIDDPWADRKLLSHCAAASVAPERTSHCSHVDLRRSLLHPILVRTAMCTQVSGLDDAALEQVFGPAECARKLRLMAEQREAAALTEGEAGNSNSDSSSNSPAVVVTVDEIEKALASGGCYDVSVLRGLLSSFAAADANNLAAHAEVLDGLLGLAQSSEQHAAAALSQALLGVADDDAQEDKDLGDASSVSPSSAAHVSAASWTKLKRYAGSVRSLTQRIQAVSCEAAAAAGEAASLGLEADAIRASLRELESNRQGMKTRLDELSAAERKQQQERDRRRVEQRRQVEQLRAALDAIEAQRLEALHEVQQLRSQLDQAKELEGARIDQARELRAAVQASRSEIAALNNDVVSLGAGSSISNSNRFSLEKKSDSQSEESSSSSSATLGLGIYNDISAAERNIKELREKLELSKKKTVSAAGSAILDHLLDSNVAQARSRAAAYSFACKTTSAALKEQKKAEEERRISQRELDDLRSKLKTGDVQRLRQAIQTAHERLEKLQQQEKEAIKAKENRSQLVTLQKQLDKVVLAQEQELVLAQNQLATKRQAVDALVKARDQQGKSAVASASSTPNIVNNNNNNSHNHSAVPRKNSLDFSEKQQSSSSQPNTPRLECATEIIHIAGGSSNNLLIVGKDYDTEIKVANEKLARKKQRVARLREIVANRVASIRGSGIEDAAAGPPSLDSTATKESLVHQCIKQRASLTQIMKKELAASSGSKKRRGSHNVSNNGSASGTLARVPHADLARGGGGDRSSDDEDDDDDENDDDAYDYLTAAASHHGAPKTKSVAASSVTSTAALTNFASSLVAAVKSERDAEVFQGLVAQVQAKLRIVESLEAEAAEIPRLEEQLRAATKRL